MPQNDVVFSGAAGTPNGSHVVDSTFSGSTVNICLIGEGGSGGAGLSNGTGGGGGGAGGVVHGTMAAQAGDTFTVTHTPANTRTTAGAGANGASITITNNRTNVSWTANGGSGGGQGDNAGGGNGGGGSGTGAIVNTGGNGGNSGGSGGNSADNGTIGTGGTAGGTAGTNTSNGFAGGGGGGIGGIPAFLTNLYADVGIVITARDGGQGPSSTTDGFGSARTGNSTQYIDNDGRSGKEVTTPPEAAVGFSGMGGGGAGSIGSGATGNALGGAGGHALAVLSYDFEGTPPVITLQGNTTAGSPHIVEAGGSFVEPGASALDSTGKAIPAVANIPAELATPISGDVNSQHTIEYTATDSQGVQAVPVTRVCEIRDTVGPTIVLNGSSTFEVELNSTFTDPGATGYDNAGGGSNNDGTYAFAEMTVGGDTVDTSVVASYEITYDLTDVNGNVADQVIRTVNVVTQLSTRANETGPSQTPDGPTSEIRFSEIIAASQLFRRINPSVSPSDLGTTDTSPRYLQNNSLNYLRGWFRDYGAPLNATRTLSTPDPGSVGNLAGSTVNNTEVSMNDFKSYSALTTKVRVKPETLELYRNSNDAEIQIGAWGPYNRTSGLAAGLCDISIKPSYTGTWVEVANIKQGNGAEFTNLNRAFSSKAGGDGSITTSAGTNRRDPNTTYNYEIKIKFRGQGGVAAIVTHDELSIDIGQSGQSAVLHYSGTSTNFQWRGNNTSVAGSFSDYVIEHLGSIIERTAT